MSGGAEVRLGCDRGVAPIGNVYVHAQRWRALLHAADSRSVAAEPIDADLRRVASWCEQGAVRELSRVGGDQHHLAEPCYAEDSVHDSLPVAYGGWGDGIRPPSWERFLPQVSGFGRRKSPVDRVIVK